MAETTIIELAKPSEGQRGWTSDINANWDLLDQITILCRVTNTDSQDLDVGSVCKLDTANDKSVQASDTENDPNVVGVVFENTIVQDVGEGLIVVVGYCEHVKVTGTVSAGDYLTSSTTEKFARKAEWYEVVFGRAITDASGGEVEAILWQPQYYEIVSAMLCLFDIGLFDIHLFA